MKQGISRRMVMTVSTYASCYKFNGRIIAKCKSRWINDQCRLPRFCAPRKYSLQLNQWKCHWFKQRRDFTEGRRICVAGFQQLYSTANIPIQNYMNITDFYSRDVTRSQRMNDIFGQTLINLLQNIWILSFIYY